MRFSFWAFLKKCPARSPIWPRLNIVPLPIATEVNRLAAPQVQSSNPVHLVSVRGAPVVFPPRGLLGVAEEVCPSNVMVDANFSAAQAAEVLFSPVRRSAIKRIRLLMINPLNFKPLMQVVPCGGFVSMDDSALRNP